MKLGTRGRYAVMATVDLACYGAGRPVALSEISIRQGISLHYLEQIFIKLRRANIVVSVRGVNGGYKLAQPAQKISMAHIIEAADESLKATRCTTNTEGCMTSGARCLVHGLWEGLGAQVQTYLSNISLDDVMQKRVRVARRAGIV